MEGKMRAAVLKDNRNIEVVQVPLTPPGEGQVQIRVHYCGICGSDIGIVYEHAHRYPLIPGHEFSGVVAVAAPGWEHLMGKAMTAYPIVGCGRCPLCLEGDTTKCPQYNFIGSRSDGAFAEYINVPGSNALELGGLSLREGALVEPLAVAAHAVRRAPQGALGVVCIVGAGPIGLLVAQACRAMGAREVIALDVDDRKVELARKYGFENSLNSRIGDPMDTLARLGAEPGAGCVFECSGTGAGLESALALAAPGGCVVMVGIHKRDVTLSPASTRAVMKKELGLTGAWVSNCADGDPNSDWRISMELIGSGKVNAAALITEEISLEEVPRTLERMHSNPGGQMKTLIKLIAE